MTAPTGPSPAAAPAAAAATATDTSSDTPSTAFYRATSLLSIWGPCRAVGDAYLSCVVSEGMGMCKPLRRSFEQCAAETSEYSVSVLDQLAMQACGHIEESNPIARRNCAAEMLLQQQQRQRQQQGPQLP